MKLTITVNVDTAPDDYNYYELGKLIRGELDINPENKIKFTLNGILVYEDRQDEE